MERGCKVPGFTLHIRIRQFSSFRKQNCRIPSSMVGSGSAQMIACWTPLWTGEEDAAGLCLGRTTRENRSTQIYSVLINLNPWKRENTLCWSRFIIKVTVLGWTVCLFCCTFPDSVLNEAFLSLSSIFSLIRLENKWWVYEASNQELLSTCV